MHHPLHWLADWNHSSLRLELERRGTIVLTGHEHVADACWTSALRGGALYVPTACLFQGSRRLPIAYSILDIEPRDCVVKVTIRSWKVERGEFDSASEYCRDGEATFDLPQEIGRGLPTPRYTTVATSLTELAKKSNSFAELLSDVRFDRVPDLIVEPRFFPAPFTQIAATVTLARSQGKSSSALSPLSPIAYGERLHAARVAVITGEHLAGVTHAVVWLLADRYERDAAHAPVYVKYRQLAGRDRVDRLVRAVAPSFGLTGDPDEPLPPLLVAIDDVEYGDTAFVRELIEHVRAHPENRYLLGCHDNDGPAIVSALSDASVACEHGYLGPFGLAQLRELVSELVAIHSFPRWMPS